MKSEKEIRKIIDKLKMDLQELDYYKYIRDWEAIRGEIEALKWVLGENNG